MRFDVVSVADAGQRAIAEHAYPYVDGANVEDLGEAARHIQIDAFFWGDDYLTRLQQFMQALGARGAGELLHPVFGSRTVQVMNWRIPHDADGIDQAHVNVEFVESIAGRPFFDQTLPTQKAAAIGLAASLARAASTNRLADLIAGAVNNSPLAALDTLRSRMFGAFSAIQARVTGVIVAGLDALSFPRSWAADVAALVDGVTNLYVFTGNSLMADWRSGNDIVTLLRPVTSTTSASGVITPIVLPASIVAVAAVVDAHLAVERAVGFANTAQLVFEAEADTPTLSPVDIETVANTSRQTIEDTITLVRAAHGVEYARQICEPLKDTALAIQDAARAIIEARPPLIVRSVEAPGNLRLIAHRWYGDHTRAPELFRLNNLRLPNFIQTGDPLNAYAN